jgi:hypothetical protein
MDFLTALLQRDILLLGEPCAKASSQFQENSLKRSLQ